MRILFALDPWIYRDTAGEQLFTLENIFAPAIKALSSYGHDLRLLVGEDIIEIIGSKPLDISCTSTAIPLKELYSVYSDHYTAHLIQHQNRDTKEQVAMFGILASRALGEWYPDVIIAFSTPVSIWKKCFPNSLAMQFENGIFSRPPYPYLCQLDPFGFLSRSYPYIFKDSLRKESITDAETSRIIQLRRNYDEMIFGPYNPIEKENLTDFPGQKTLLVPLSYNGVVINDAASTYRSQLDFLLNILFKVPEDTLVFFTKHSLQTTGGIPEATESYLLRRFPNLRYNEQFNKYAFCSQWLIPLIDGVISLNSTVAYHAALWGKKVFTLGECEINSIATATKLDNIGDDLATVHDFDQRAFNVLYRLLTRYCFPLKDFHNPVWLTDHFEKLIQSKRDGRLEVDYKGMPLIGDEDKIFARLISESPAVQNDYKVRVRY